MAPRVRDWSDDGIDQPARDRLPTQARLYTDALRALARRELTSRQLRDKLGLIGGRAADVDAVLRRLKDEGALDDLRAARLFAQTAFRQRKRPRARILQELEQRQGIEPAVAREVTDEVCGADVERRRLEHTVIAALRGTRRDHRDEDARRLFASLVRRGYDPDGIKLALARAGVDTEVLDRD